MHRLSYQSHSWYSNCSTCLLRSRGPEHPPSSPRGYANGEYTQPPALGCYVWAVCELSWCEQLQLRWKTFDLPPLKCASALTPAQKYTKSSRLKWKLEKISMSMREKVDHRDDRLLVFRTRGITRFRKKTDKQRNLVKGLETSPTDRNRLRWRIRFSEQVCFELRAKQWKSDGRW